MKTAGYDLHIELNLHRECNFNCPYCFNNQYKYKIKAWFKHKLLRKKSLKQMDINDISTNIDKINRKCHIHLSGGEPFLFPRFIELCKLLTRKSTISVITNLSLKNVYEFADNINPRRVGLINISLHITELERYNLVENFIGKVKYLKKKGFKTKVKYVMYPPLFKRFERDYKLFKSHNIIVEPKSFEGRYLFKEYPRSYSIKQKEVFLRYSNKNGKILLSSNFNFKGKKCLAGKSSIVVKPDGLVYRCWGDLKPIGNFLKGEIRLHDKVRPCEVGKCICPTEGLMLVLD